MSELQSLVDAITKHLTGAAIRRSQMGVDSITIDIIAADGGFGSLKEIEEQVVAGIEDVRLAGQLKSTINVNVQTLYR